MAKDNFKDGLLGCKEKRGWFGWLLDLLPAIRKDIRQVMLNQTELQQGLVALQNQVGKVAKEQSDRFDVLTAKIKELEDAINNGTVRPEVEAAFKDVQTALQSLDDTIPDAPPV